MEVLNSGGMRNWVSLGGGMAEWATLENAPYDVEPTVVFPFKPKNSFISNIERSEQ